MAMLSQAAKSERSHKMTKKEKPEIKTIEDVQQLPAEDQTKWEIANELGYFDKIVATGWKSLTSRESGRIGGMLSSDNS